MYKHFKRYKKMLVKVVLGIFVVYISMNPVFGFEIDNYINNETYEIKVPEISLNETVVNDTVILDISHVSQGYIAVKYEGDNSKVKISVSSENEKNIYDLMEDQYDEYIVLPLHAGNGEYEVNIHEHVKGSSYLAVLTTSFETEMDDEFLPFLHPSVLVPFSPDSNAVQIARIITKTSASDMEKIESILHYLTAKIDYDENLSNEVYETNKAYIPDIDGVLAEQKGICIDYATVMAAMLRSLGIPAQVAIGDLCPQEQDVLRHAWVKACLRDAGHEWIDVDPTYGYSYNVFSRGYTSPNATYVLDYYY